MKNLPPELVYGLIFVAILLFQYLTRRFRPQEPQQEPAPEESPPQFEQEVEETTAAAAPSVSVGHFGRTEVPPPAPAAPAKRRFARRSLMGSKREMQNAIVIATILGPCRAFEQHDIR